MSIEEVCVVDPTSRERSPPAAPDRDEHTDAPPGNAGLAEGYADVPVGMEVTR